MKVALLAQQIEDLGAEIVSITKKFSIGKKVYQIDIVEPDSTVSVKNVEGLEVKAIPLADMFTTDIFSTIKKCCDEGVADKNLKPGQQILIPHFKVPAVKDCEGEEFDEIDLENVVITIVHVEPRRVVFNFENILFRHDIDCKESGKPFEETPLGVYLATHFASTLEKYTGKVDVSLLSKDNVFNEDSKDFMPYFKPIKNKIKVLASENDTWYWWLKTPYTGSADYYCYVSGNGNANGDIASDESGVAPAFEFTADSE